MSKKITQEQMLRAIKNSQGLISKVQRKLESDMGEKICWDTVEKYIHKWESCEKALRQEKNIVLDLAENNIIKELANGDTATSKWYLRMKGKERGYEDSSVVKIDSTDPLNINITGDTMTAGQLEDSSMVEIPDYGEITESE